MAMHLVKRFGRLTTLVRAGRWAERGTVSRRRPRRLRARRRRLRADRPARRRARHGPGHAGARLRPGERAPGRGALRRPRRAGLAQRRHHLHLPLLESTHHLVDAELLVTSSRGALLVNCGRGGLIDLDAVHAALLDGRLGGVGLDVFDPEPPQHHPLFDHPDVVLTPHLMGLSRQATAATFVDAAQRCRRRARRPTAGRGRQPRLGAHPTTPRRTESRHEGPADGTRSCWSAAAPRASAPASRGPPPARAPRWSWPAATPTAARQVAAELREGGADGVLRARRHQRREPGPGRGRGDRRAARPDRRAGQRRRADHPRHDARHHARALRPARRRQPARPVLPHAGGHRRHGAPGRARRASSTCCRSTRTAARRSSRPTSRRRPGWPAPRRTPRTPTAGTGSASTA